MSSERVVAVVSFRLGGTDGVSVEASKWEGAWRALGFHVRRVAGEIHGPGRADDVVLPWLAIDPPAGHADPRPDQLAVALGRAEVVVVENVCSLPMNLAAARATADVVSRRAGAVVLHHHDLAWQREQFSGLAGFPPDSPTTVHVVINERTRGELVERGFDARRVARVPNCFDVDAPAGDRDATRRAMGFAGDDVVVLQPTRAIARKNVPGALAFVGELGRRLPGRRVRYWLTGPAEDGYGPELDRLLADAPVPVTVGRVERAADAYAACDLVLFPSTWEGFGNPLVEAAVARRAVVAGAYPVRDELAALGLTFLPLDDPCAAARWTESPDPARLDANMACVHRHLSLASLPGRLRAALTPYATFAPEAAVANRVGAS